MSYSTTEAATDMGGDYGITISIRAVDAAGDEIPPTWQEFACRWEDKRSTYLKVSDDEASEVIAVSDAKVICEAQIEAEALVRPVVGGVPGIVYEVKAVKSTPGLWGSGGVPCSLSGAWASDPNPDPTNRRQVGEDDRRGLPGVAEGGRDRRPKEHPGDGLRPLPFHRGPFYESGDAQLEEIGKLVGIGVKFDLRNPETAAWIMKYGAAEVKYIDETAKATIRDIVLRGQTEGLTPTAQAKLIKDHIGLLPRQLRALRPSRRGLVGDE